MKAVLAGLLISLLSCGVRVPQSREVTFQTLARGANGGVCESRNAVVKTESEWAALWKAVHAQGEPPAPHVDFSKQMVIAVFQGERSSGGHSIEVKKMVEEGGQVKVLVEEVAPGKNCLSAMVITCPYHLVVTAKRNGEVSFSRQSITRDCN